MTIAGQAAELLESGEWLPMRAAARELGVSIAELIHRARTGEVRTRTVGPRNRRLFHVGGRKC